MPRCSGCWTTRLKRMTPTRRRTRCVLVVAGANLHAAVGWRGAKCSLIAILSCLVAAGKIMLAQRCNLHAKHLLEVCHHAVVCSASPAARLQAAPSCGSGDAGIHWRSGGAHRHRPVCAGDQRQQAATRRRRQHHGGLPCCRAGGRCRVPRAASWHGAALAAGGPKGLQAYAWGS